MRKLITLFAGMALGATFASVADAATKTLVLGDYGSTAVQTAILADLTGTDSRFDHANSGAYDLSAGLPTASYLAGFNSVLVYTDSVSVDIFKLAAAALALRPGRRVIVTEAGNFPTDVYVLQGLAQQRSPQADDQVAAAHRPSSCGAPEHMLESQRCRHRRVVGVHAADWLAHRRERAAQAVKLRSVRGPAAQRVVEHARVSRAGDLQHQRLGLRVAGGDQLPLDMEVENVAALLRQHEAPILQSTVVIQATRIVDGHGVRHQRAVESLRAARRVVRVGVKWLYLPRDVLQRCDDVAHAPTLRRRPWSALRCSRAWARSAAKSGLRTHCDP